MKHSVRHTISLIGYSFLLIALSSSFVYAQNLEAYQRAQEDWAHVLKNFVDEEGRTDFIALSENPQKLESVVAFIESTSPSSHPNLFPSAEAVIAYYINTYNALAMYGVIDEGIPKGFTNFFSRASFFKFRDVTIGNEETNLYDFENDVIRPLDEPRSHFALNCMVRDCPRLPQVPFTADHLNAELDAVTWEFFSKPRHFYYDHEEKEVYVSEILDFYTEDFVPSGKAKDLDVYINRYLKEPIPEDYEIEFIDYDWRINQQPKP